MHFFNTNEFAEALRIKPETIRRSLCVNGHYLGVKPVKLPNNRLLWPEEPCKTIIDTSAGGARP